MSFSSLETLCPFCGNPNRCGVAAVEGCWCGKVEIPIEMIELLPEPRKSCICFECVRSYQGDPPAFIQRFRFGSS